MRQFLNITKALSDENRVRVLMALRTGELCVCEIIEMLDLAPSTVSKHISILMQAELVECRKDGRWHYYRLAGPETSQASQATHEWMAALLKNDKRVAQDLKQLKTICRNNGKELDACCKD